MALGTGLQRRSARPTDPPSLLSWQTAPLEADLDVVGDIELCLDASATASDTGWIVLLEDVAPDGSAETITQGWLRASLREVDEGRSRPGAPVLPCRRPQVVPIGEVVGYRIPLVPNARRFRPLHSIRLTVCSDDQPDEVPVIMGFRHAPVGTSSVNTIHSSSRLLLSTI